MDTKCQDDIESILFAAAFAKIFNESKHCKDDVPINCLIARDESVHLAFGNYLLNSRNKTNPKMTKLPLMNTYLTNDI